MYETSKENSPYRQYQESGGIINEKEYESALARARSAATAPEHALKQVGNMAEFAGIELHNTKDAIDQRIILYGILCADKKPEGVKHHHSQMPVQRLFAEALRMLGDTDALNKLIGAYHRVGIHCPICLRTAVPGKECR